ncbi:MAG: cohesin domain-containing protein, partial [Saprospiraceae bacterium]
VDSMLNVEHYFKGAGIRATKAEYEAGNAQIWLPSTRTSGLVFDCLDIPNGKSETVSIEVWITDLAGNQDYCTVNLVLQSNTNICDNTDSLFVSVKGRVNVGASEYAGAEVSLVSTSPEKNKVVITNAYGEYAFPGLQKLSTYTVSITDNRNIMNGVSTLDLVMIQRHILGLETLNDPKKIIAADVDNNSKVTAADLVALRKNILGITNEFPNGQKSWRFITTNHLFANPDTPFPFAEQYLYNQLDVSRVNQNFYGIKIGDVNTSAKVNLHDPSVEQRSNKQLSLRIDPLSATENSTVLVPVYAVDFEGVMGYQFTINFDPDALSLAEIRPGALQTNDGNFGVHRLDRGQISTSWNTEIPVIVNEDQPLFTLQFNTLKSIMDYQGVTISSDITSAEAYDDQLNTMKVSLMSRSNPSFAGFRLDQNKPNPFIDKTIIGFNIPVSGFVRLTLTDIAGKVLKVINANYSKGEHTIEINASDLGGSGLVMYKIECGPYTETHKMMILE